VFYIENRTIAALVLGIAMLVIAFVRLVIELIKLDRH